MAELITPVGLVFDFTPIQKECMLNVLAKYPDAPCHHEGIANCLRVDGSTVLWVGQAIYLAGIICPYYSFLTERILRHPCVVEALAKGDIDGTC